MKSVDFPEMRRKLSRLARKLAMVGLAVLCSLFIAELGLRIVWHNPYRNETTDEVLVLPIQHSRRHFIFSRPLISKGPGAVQFRTDDRGYIRPSHQFENPDLTVAFLGGSTTECMAVDEPLRFPALVSTLLGKRGLKVNTLNAGRSANNTHDALNVLINHVVEDRPDVVILMEAWSDRELLSGDGSYQKSMVSQSNFASMMRWPLQRATSLSYLAALLRVWTSIRVAPTVIEQAGDHYVRSIPAPPVEEFVSRLRAFVRVSRAFGITPALMTQPFAKQSANPHTDLAAQDHALFNDAIRNVAREEEVLLIDLARHFVEDVSGWDEPMAYFYDRIHANDRGSQEEASFIARRLGETVLAPKLATKQSQPATESHAESDGKGSKERQPIFVIPLVP